MPISLTINDHVYKSVAKRDIANAISAEDVGSAVELRTNMQKVTDWFGFTEHESVIRNLFSKLEHGKDFSTWQRNVSKLANFVKDKKAFKEAFRVTRENIQSSGEAAEQTKFTLKVFDTDVISKTFDRNLSSSNNDFQLSKHVFKTVPAENASTTTFALVDHFYTAPHLSPIAFALECFAPVKKASSATNHFLPDFQYQAQVAAEKLQQCKDSGELHNWIMDLLSQAAPQHRQAFQKLFQLNVSKNGDSSTATILVSGITIGKMSFKGNLTLNDHVFVEKNPGQDNPKIYQINSAMLSGCFIVTNAQWNEYIAARQDEMFPPLVIDSKCIAQVHRDLLGQSGHLPQTSSDPNVFTAETFKTQVKQVFAKYSPTTQPAPGTKEQEIINAFLTFNLQEKREFVADTAPQNWESAQKISELQKTFAQFSEDQKISVIKGIEALANSTVFKTSGLVNEFIQRFSKLNSYGQSNFKHSMATARMKDIEKNWSQLSTEQQKLLAQYLRLNSKSQAHVQMTFNIDRIKDVPAVKDVIGTFSRSTRTEQDNFYRQITTPPNLIDTQKIGLLEQQFAQLTSAQQQSLRQSLLFSPDEFKWLGDVKEFESVFRKLPPTDRSFLVLSTAQGLVNSAILNIHRFDTETSKEERVFYYQFTPTGANVNIPIVIDDKKPSPKRWATGEVEVKLEVVESEGELGTIKVVGLPTLSNLTIYDQSGQKVPVCEREYKAQMGLDDDDLPLPVLQRQHDTYASLAFSMMYEN